MNEVQVIAFWVWYKTGFNGNGIRSFSKAAKVLRKSPNTLKEWHDKFDWAGLAEREDNKINRKIEREVEREIVRDYKDALDRQRKIITLLYEQFVKHIKKISAKSLKVIDLIKLMEFETNYVFDEDRGQPKGNLLSVVLQMMPAEDRTKFYATVERAKDAGAIQLAPMGPPRSN